MTGAMPAGITSTLPKRLPNSDYYYRLVKSYIEQDPDPAYAHASEQSVSAFRDMKYGVRIHWGLYAIAGRTQPGESWPFLWMSNAEKQAYQNLYRTFNPVGFDAQAWMRLFQRVGMQCVAFTAKHHDGFSMFDTKTRVQRRMQWTAPGGPRIESCDLAYSIMDTPFKRDIVREVCTAARSSGLKINLYFSHPDWYDVDFRPYAFHPVQVPSSPALMVEYDELLERKYAYPVIPDPTPEETARMMARHRAQLVGLLSNYGPIDMICLDQWFGPAVWPYLRDTMKILRAIQPEVMFRARGIGNYGDYYTPEGFVPGEKEPTTMPWMVIHTLAAAMSYDPVDAHYKGSAWIIDNLIDSVAKGGNFMVGIGPDAQGQWHPAAVQQLEEAGEWLRVNGEAIYATRERPGDLWHEGEAVCFTRSKDAASIYALCRQWPGRTLTLQTVQPVPGSRITLLGYDTPLAWQCSASGALTITLPDDLPSPERRPCPQAYAIKIAAAET